VTISTLSGNRRMLASTAMRRRDALKRLGALAGLAAVPDLLSGCGDNDSGEEGITTIVVVMMENRSYDHFLGARALEGLPGDGLVAGMSNPNLAGDPVAVYRDPVMCVHPDPPHSRSSSLAQWNRGANDGFVTRYQAQSDVTDLHVMGYLTRDEQPLSWALADEFASCDRWFCSMMGPTWPNRMYLHSAQSGGMTSNDLPAGGFPWRSIWHSLSDAGVPWTYYFSDLPFVPLFADLEYDGLVRRVNYDFFDDAAAGRLPPVTFVDPNSVFNDDHPPHHPMLGQQFLSAIYHALANGPQWNNCLLVVTYDEHGGFFDHVSPPTAPDDYADQGLDQLGFRVPALVAGPYVKRGHTSSVVRDHSSVLAHINGMFGLEPLTARDAAATDLGELLDLDRLAAGNPRPPAALPFIEVDESMVEDGCFAARTEISQDLQVLANQGFFPPEFDLRGDTRDYAYAIGDTLERWNAGRIRRGR
jgi:phospholipase C